MSVRHLDSDACREAGARWHPPARIYPRSCVISGLNIVLITEGATEAASLAGWMKRQGYEVSVISVADRMGPSETLSLSVAGAAIARAALMTVREWIRARQTTVTLEIDGRGRFTAAGPAELSELIGALAPADAGTAADE